MVGVQYGFRRGRTTSNAVICQLKNSYESINDHRYFGVVSLDLSKAYDTFDRDVMQQILEKYGIRARGVSRYIFISYLSGI